jgi:membrane associated rhomboid family serine protease
LVPLYDENKTRSRPIVTYWLIGINVVIFLYEISLPPQALEQFFFSWAMVPEQITASFQGELANPIRAWLTLITSQFLHGGFLHLGGNMLYLWVFGNNIEDTLGGKRYIIFYLACGVLAALTQWAFDPSSSVPTLGASGAIAGVMGAYILKFPRARIVTLVPIVFFFTTFRIPAIYLLGFWFIQQTFYGLVSIGEVDVGAGGVAYWAHAGGFVFGLILGPLLGLNLGNKPPPKRR